MAGIHVVLRRISRADEGSGGASYGGAIGVDGFEFAGTMWVKVYFSHVQKHVDYFTRRNAALISKCHCRYDQNRR